MREAKGTHLHLDIRDLVEENDKLQQEIERLNKELETVKDNFDFNLGAIENIRKENNRLNNIIEELEKTLNNYDLDYMDLVGEHLLADILEDLKDKIKELKGSDKK